MSDRVIEMCDATKAHALACLVNSLGCDVVVPIHDQVHFTPRGKRLVMWTDKGSLTMHLKLMSPEEIRAAGWVAIPGSENWSAEKGGA